MVGNRRGLDEAALDITSEVLKRVVSMPTKDFSGHVIGLEIIGVNENDIKVSYASNTDQNISDYYIMVGSQVVAEIRVAVEKETGFQCSAGIAFNVNLLWFYSLLSFMCISLKKHTIILAILQLI